MTTKGNMYFGKDLEAMSFASNYHEWILDEIRPYLGANIAEVGAGMGNFTSFLLTEEVKNLVAYEPSVNMYPALNDRFKEYENVKTINSLFENDDSYNDNHFDSVVYINVLEHIEDDKHALSQAYTKIKDNGHIIIFVPALSMLYSNLDKTLGHYRRYHKKELSDITISAGFNITKVKYFDIAGIIPWYIAFVLMKQTTTALNVSAYDKLVVPVMKRIEKVAPPFIGKNLLLIGKKS